ncbi:MAG: hypothetical protein WCA82_11440 [Jiangellales bacterium]
MITRPLIATAVAVAAVAGTASAASLTISSHPTLANISVAVPGCDDATPAAVPIAWTPARECAPATEATDMTPLVDDSLTPEVEVTETSAEPATSDPEDGEAAPPPADTVQPSDPALPSSEPEASADE